MQLFVLRHGHAEPQQTSDEARNLSAAGRSEVAAMAARSIVDIECVEQVWVSPLRRAQQTAEIVCGELKQCSVNFTLSTTDLLVPEASPIQLFDALQTAQSEAILLVSHQPLVGQFIDMFCGSNSGFHAMNTSSMACIDYDIAAPGLGSLRWLRHSHA